MMFSGAWSSFSLCGADLREKAPSKDMGHGKGTAANEFLSDFIAIWLNTRVVLWLRFFISDHPGEATRPSLRVLLAPGGWQGPRQDDSSGQAA